MDTRAGPGAPVTIPSAPPQYHERPPVRGRQTSVEPADQKQISGLRRDGVAQNALRGSVHLKGYWVLILLIEADSLSQDVLDLRVHFFFS